DDWFGWRLQFSGNAPSEQPTERSQLDTQRQHCITIQHGGFTCEADTLGSHGYIYICIYPATSMDANTDRKSACGNIFPSTPP
ncbi:type IV toxin-antitoxin system YeeU family antitoxin, partial [Aeromonas dhakensis]|uniref:type IV toxin-antitoxin system YeeU family antitoxin n=1 Tax=Aeromonas dhakensis TaxID=196024 RepID=UPI0021571D6E